MTAQLIELVYSSQTHENISEDELLNILANARKKNDQNDITGMLTFDNAMFIQVLEGKEQQVSTLFEKIKKDPRHFSVNLLYKSPIKERSFAKWSMAYVFVNPNAQQELIEKYSVNVDDIAKTRVTAGNGNVGKELLLIYRENHL